MRTQSQIQAELDQAYAADRTFRVNTPEYRENRMLIGLLVGELSRATPIAPMSASQIWVEYNMPDAEQAQLDKQRERLAEVQRNRIVGRFQIGEAA